MHLRGMRAGLVQNLRLFLCMDLGIKRGVLLAGFAAGRLGCWWAGLLVGFAAGRLAVNTMIVILFCYIIFHLLCQPLLRSFLVLLVELIS